MRCAVSERMGAGLGQGHHEWVDALRADGMEFVVVFDAQPRPARQLASDGVSAVLLAEAPTDAEIARPSTDIRRSSRHRVERELVRFARAHRLPVVGIGQGAGFLGLYFGGRLCPAPPAPEAGARMTIRQDRARQSGQESVLRAGPVLSDPRSFPGVLQAVAWDEHDHIAGFVHRDEAILGLYWQPDTAQDATARWISDVLRGSNPARAGARPEPQRISTG